MKRVDSASFITHVSIDRTGDFHAIMRSGQYGCVYDNFFESRRNISILDLETGRVIKNFRLNRGEGIKCFNAPHIVSKEGNIWKVWDVTSSSSDPKKIFELKISYLAKVAIEGNTLVAISGTDPFLSRNPSHITVVKDIERAYETTEKFFDEFIDEKSGLLIHQNNVIYSTQLGSVKIASLVDRASFKIIHFRADEGGEHSDIDIREPLSEANGQIQSGDAPIAPAPRGWCAIL